MHGNSAQMGPGIIEISTLTPSPPRFVSVFDHCDTVDRFNFRGVTSAIRRGVSPAILVETRPKAHLRGASPAIFKKRLII